MSVTTRFGEELVSLAESYPDDVGEPAATFRGGRFAEYAMISLHGMRIFLGKSYKMALDILATMTPILEDIGRFKADLPDPATLCKWFDRITIDVWRVLLRHSAQLDDPSDHVAVDATYYDRSRASKHYCQRTNYRVQTIEATKLVDTDPQAILDVHCTTTKHGSEAEVCAKLARRYAGELRVSLPTKAMTAAGSEPHSVSMAYDRWSNTGFTHRTIMLRTRVLTMNSTDSAQ